MARLSMEQSPVDVRSVTCSANLGRPFDLNKLTRHTTQTEFKVERRAGGVAVVKRFEAPAGSVMIFKSGKVTLLGHKTEEDARINLKRLQADLKSLGYRTSIEQFDVTQIVGHTTFDGGVNFNNLLMNPETRDRVCYQPGWDAYGTINLSDGITAKATESGSVMILGARRQNQLLVAWMELFIMLLNLNEYPRVEDFP